MITPDSFLAKSVQKGDVFAVRGAIIGVIRANLGHPAKETLEAVRYALDHDINVYEEQNDPERPIVEDRAQWNEEYYASVLVDLQQNFTKERLEHALRVSESVFSAPKPAPVQPPQPVMRQNQQPMAKPTQKQPQYQQPTPARQGTGTERKKAKSRPTGAVVVGIIAAALIIALIVLLTNR